MEEYIDRMSDVIYIGPQPSEAISDTDQTRVVFGHDRLGLGELQLLGRYRLGSAHPDLKTHTHGNVFEICLLAWGTQTYAIGNREYHLAGGDIFITHPNEVHSTGGQPEGRGALYWLQLKAPRSGKPYLGLTPEETTELVSQLHALPRKFHVGAAPIQIFEHALQIASTPDTPLRNIDLRNRLLRLLLDIIAASRTAPPLTHPPRIQRALAYIETHLSAAIPLHEIAEAAGLSLPHFKSSFKEAIGMPPGEYIARTRIERAKHELGHTNRSITELAFEIGFCSSQHFARVFKRFTGQTPRQYRAENTHRK